MTGSVQCDSTAWHDNVGKQFLIVGLDEHCNIYVVDSKTPAARAPIVEYGGEVGTVLKTINKNYKIKTVQI